MSGNDDTRKRIRETELEIYALQEKLVALRRDQGGQAVEDYVLETAAGKKPLSAYFDGHDTLILIHNMGRECAYCTAYADGINGVLDHLRSRAPVLLVSPDDATDQQEFAAARGWGFQLGSVRGSTLSRDMGFEPLPGDYQPGYCVLRRDADGVITLIGKDDFEPGDRYSPLWNILALMNGGTAGWQPRISYDDD